MGDIYHIFNRGVDKRNIFLQKGDFIRFLVCMKEFNRVASIGSIYEQKLRKYQVRQGIRNPLWVSDSYQEKLVIIHSYCLLDNHFHFILEELKQDALINFMKKIGIGYTNYFNKKLQRSGSLFQGKFKKVKILNYSQLLRLVIYVNCNSEVHKVCSKEKWIWSSFLDLAGFRSGILCNDSLVKSEFEKPYDFVNFCNEGLSSIIEDRELQNILLE